MPAGGRSGAGELAPRLRPSAWWRHALLAFIAIGSLAALFAAPPMAQDRAYHAFADQRELLGIANFADVVSNVAFLLVGVAGLQMCVGRRPSGARTCWIVFFAGVALVSLGSAYYHLAPDNGTLVWDRLPMTIASMGLFVAVLAEHVGPRAARLLPSALVLGLASVAYWHFFDDLRPYVWVQLAPLLTIPVVIAVYPKRRDGRWHLLAALALYALAKLAESWDGPIFATTREALSGHTVKHLLAALACLVVYAMLAQRSRAVPPQPAWKA